MNKPDLNKPCFVVFPEAAILIESGNCPTCGELISSFRNAASEREFSISGMCQLCQDSVYGED